MVNNICDLSIYFLFFLINMQYENQVATTNNIVLIHSYYYEKKEIRRQELETTLSININNSYIDKIHLLIEPKQLKLFDNYDFLPIQSNKIILVPVMEQPTYQKLFQYGNEIMKNNINMIIVIQNSDIVCTDSIRYAVCIKENEIFALSRYERPCGSTEFPALQCNQYQDSHDLFIFKSQIPEVITNELKFTQNHWGAENLVIYQLKKNGFNVVNPCYTIQCVHNHCSNQKHTPEQRIDNPETHGTSKPTYIDCFFD